MATFLPGPTVAEVRGSIGGCVFSRNRGGQYIRFRAVPTNRNSIWQQNVRRHLLDASQYFSETLSAADRRTWETFTQNTPTTNRVGATIVLSSIAAFVRTNSLRLIAHQSIIDKAPPTAGEAAAIDVNPAGISISEITQQIMINAAADLGNWDNTLDDDICLVFQGLPVDKNVQYFKGPYRFSWPLVGKTGDGYTFPYVMPCPLAIQAGQTSYLRFKHLDPNGKVSSDAVIPITAGA